MLNNLDNLASASGAVSTLSSESEGSIPGKQRRGSRSHSHTSRGSLGQFKTSPSSTATVSSPDPLDRNAEERRLDSSAKIPPNNLPLVKTSTSPIRNKERPYPSSPPLAPQSPTYIYNTMHNDLLTRILDPFYNSRRLAESVLLYLPLILAIYRFSARDDSQMSIQLAAIGGLSAAVSVLLQALSISPARAAELNDLGLNLGRSPKEPGRIGDREGRRSSLTSSQSHNVSSNWVFMTDSRNYRHNLDDGYLTALLIGPGLAASMLYQTTILSSQALPYRTSSWLIEPPYTSKLTPSALTALMHSRRALVQLTTLCSSLLLVHLVASSFRQRFFARAGRSDILPQSEVRRTFLYCALMSFTTIALIAFRSLGLTYVGMWDLWPELSNFDVCVISIYYQFTLYLLIRLARGGFTLGEVGIVAQGATTLLMETINLTRFRIWPETTPYVKTFRVPGPLLIFQLALIPGAILAGFLLSPLLVLSRNIAQKPSRRLKYPEQREFQRRALAGGFYVGVLLIIGAVIGTWTQWCLQGRNPWLWVIFWLAEGRTPWSRPGLIAYWFWTALFSIVWWNSQLARGGRHWSLHPPTAQASNTAVTGDDEGGTGRAGLSNVATDFLGAAKRRVSFLSLNARRKFFHALAVIMFTPGIALDPAFTHLAFSVAFSVFIFAEYIRYFALYPCGAAVHRFLSEFLDEKDGGSAILSHFYLLTGCAGPLWLEGPSRLLDFTGVLVLGVGDALASVVGKRFGRHHWSQASGKTVEGSASFAISVFLCALLLQQCGVVESFSAWRYFLCTCASALLEAFSTQSDNAVLPFFTTSLLVLAGL